MSEHFIQIQCPSCGSAEVELASPQTYRCRHCNSSFLYRDPRPPPAVAPPPRPSMPTNTWGPSPQIQPTHVYVTSHGSSAGRWIAWVVVMLVVFGGSGISAFVAWFNGSRAAATSTTATATTPTPTPQVPKAPTVTATPLPDPKPAEPAKEEEPQAEAKPAVDLQEYQSLSGCGCRADVDGDGRKDQLDLYLKAGSSTVMSAQGTERFVDVAFAVAGEGVEPFALPSTEKTAPATRYPAGRFALGVGCEGDTMVIAALDAVSAWSLSKHELRWTQALDPAFSRFAEGKAAVDCRSITVSKGVANVRTEGGTKSLRLDSGEEPERPKSRPPSTAPKSTPPKPEPKPEPKPKAEPKPPAPEPKSRPRKRKKPTEPVAPEPPAGKRKKKKKAKKAS